MTKRCCIALAMALSLSVARAAPLPPEALEDCKAMAEIANITMELRQRGASMSRLMDSAAKEPDGYWRGIQQILVEQAFQRQRYDTKEAQSLAISEFENVAYMGCLENVKRKASRN